MGFLLHRMARRRIYRELQELLAIKKVRCRTERRIHNFACLQQVRLQGLCSLNPPSPDHTREQRHPRSSPEKAGRYCGT